MLSISWLTNTLHEREIWKMDVGDRLEQKKHVCRDPTVWTSKKLSDGGATEVSYHRLPPCQQLLFDEAMTHEVSHPLA